MLIAKLNKDAPPELINQEIRYGFKDKDFVIGKNGKFIPITAEKIRLYENMKILDWEDEKHKLLIPEETIKEIKEIKKRVPISKENPKKIILTMFLLFIFIIFTMYMSIKMLSRMVNMENTAESGIVQPDIIYDENTNPTPVLSDWSSKTKTERESILNNYIKNTVGENQKRIKSIIIKDDDTIMVKTDIDKDTEEDLETIRQNLYNYIKSCPDISNEAVFIEIQDKYGIPILEDTEGETNE